MTNKCREILYGNVEVENEDFDFMMTILQRHTDADSKIGCGVKRMWSEPNPVYVHTRNFFIERHDGSITDFSFTHCITPKDKFKKACRNAIHPQVQAFRKANNMDRSRHADHDPESFDSILARFVEIHGKSKVVDTQDLSYGCELADPEYQQKWYDFHQQEAKLRDIPWRDNLTKKRS